MIWPELQAFAPVAVGRILNTLPEGLLIAAFAWIMLRILPRQNSGTRFAVWLVALLAVVMLPFISPGEERAASAVALPHPLLNISSAWGLGLFALWMLAASVSLLRLASGLWRLRKLRTSCTAIDLSCLEPSVAKTVASFSASRSVTLATSGSVSVPAAIGFFRPLIVLPSWALTELPPEELNIILLHEFAHLRRWDDWTNLLQKFVRAVFLFHPAVWWIENRLSLEREMACDDQVLAQTSNPRGYANCLIALLEKSVARKGVVMAQAAVHRAKEASLRLAQILDVHRSNSKHVWKPALGCVSAVAVMCLMVAPRLPEFVTFESGMQPVRAASAAVAPVQLPLAGAVVTPASFHGNPPLLLDKPAHRAATRVPSQTTTSDRVVVPSFPSVTVEAEATPVQTVSASVEETLAQPTEAFLMIRTTQRIGPDSWTYSVHVWRVVWTIPAQNDSQKAPVAHKT